ncbi:hypothetical protein [Streptomyces sp. NBC_01235]|nr:hypothetical protein OG289_03330 [Streptomyces sp. NBC_01235]
MQPTTVGGRAYAGDTLTGAVAGEVRPVATPGTLPHCLKAW